MLVNLRLGELVVVIIAIRLIKLIMRLIITRD